MGSSMPLGGREWEGGLTGPSEDLEALRGCRVFGINEQQRHVMAWRAQFLEGEPGGVGTEGCPDWAGNKRLLLLTSLLFRGPGP